MTHPTTGRTPPAAPPPASERGSATLEMVVMLPLLFLLLFSGLQGALHHHARSLAIAAAHEGARAAAAEHGTLQAGVAAARAYLDDVAGDSLTVGSVTGQRTFTSATITVSGTSLSVIPGWNPRVSQTSTQPVERITR